MKSNNAFGVIALLSCFAALVFSSCSGPHSYPNAGPERVIDGFVTAWNSHDMAELCVIFAEDADWVSVSGKRVKGCREIQSLLEKEHATWARETTIHKTSSSVRQIGNDVAVVYFHWEISGARNREGQRAGPFRGVTLLAVRQLSGRWRAVAGQATNAREQ